MAGWNADTLARPAGEGAVTIVEGSSFCISAANGDMVPTLPHGVFVRDTRLVSRWTLLVDGMPVESLAAMTPEPHRAVMIGRAAHVPGQADTPVIVERDRRLDGHLRELVTLRSFSRTELKCRVEVVLEADFADIFEVKEGRAAGVAQPRVSEPRGRMLIESASHPERLGLAVSAARSTLAADRVIFDVTLPPHGTWSEELRLNPTRAGEEITFRPHQEGIADMLSSSEKYLDWHANIPRPALEDGAIEKVLLQSHRDLGALRIEDPVHRERQVVAAGVPWFMALFGRDSLLTSFMSLPLDPSLALGTLRTLAELQGTATEPASEEQPGRILHEVRLGATTNLALGGKSVYFGSIDATPLFVDTLAELARWGGLPEDHADLLRAADNALEWVEEFGDRDGDGFVEYARLNEHGLINQGWKDSWDGINFANGSLAEAPIALCEVQGYVYSAYRSRAELASFAGQLDQASDLEQRAAALKAEFNARFWLPDRGYFAIALDKDKRPVDACASNMGHCLWSGIVDDDKAAHVAEKLLSREMFTGWGIRTLASDMGAYNPASYHNGSVWPHDNAIIAAGLMRYGFVEEAQRVIYALFEAAARFDSRLPELFCGFDRSEYAEPVPYPASCSPQAWAAAAPIMMMRTLLRFDPCLPRKEVWLAPTVQETLGAVQLRDIPLAGSRVSLDVSGRGVSITGVPEGLTLRREPRPRAFGMAGDTRS
ncbi:amylo-alpha-1,6-glucosidase [Ruicaihuangia caeni]|uniref:amylo-alpha-1,6-glucosidase n=1 Tax=Ruicaihuangia caeni TaxID=3042517 RepID=UPI00338E1F8F